MVAAGSNPAGVANFLPKRGHMARRARRNLTEDEREQMRALHRANPRLRYKEIGALFGVSESCVCQTVNCTIADTRSVLLPVPASRVAMKTPTCSVKQPDSIISPIPRARLMGGNARIAKTS